MNMSNSNPAKDTEKPSGWVRFFRLFVPKISKSSERPDLVKQMREVTEHEQRTVSALLPTIPAAAVIYVTVNIMVQVQGNKNTALAIVTNLPLGSLAMVILINAANLILLSMTIAAPAIALDERQQPFVRKVFSVATFVCLYIYALAFSALFAAGSLLLTYIMWRIRHAASTRAQGFTEWVRDDTAPKDAALFEYWTKARTLMHTENAQTENTEDGKLLELRRAVRERRQEIWDAGKPDFRNAIYRSGALLISGYGIMLLTTPVQLGPLEIVQLKSGPSIMGYVLIASEDRGVVFDGKNKAVKPIVASDITRRLVCTKTPSWTSMTIGDLAKINEMTWTSREYCS